MRTDTESCQTRASRAWISTRAALISLPCAFAFLMAGCEQANSPPATPSTTSTASRLPKPDTETVSVMVDSVNYMHERATKYTLYDLSKTPPRAVGGAIVNPLVSGGEKGCCLSLPLHWRPDMKVRLDWHEADFDRTYENQTRELEIPRYDAPADLYVAFYPNKEVELVVSGPEPGHPDWRGRFKKTPWEQCVETNGRKPCFLALPKMFDTQSSQGFCTYLKDEPRPESEILCETAMHMCMNDYEDQAFCDGILWGKRRK